MAKNHTFTNTRIQTKKDTAANWSTNNPVLLDGEEILVVTNAGEVRKKVGDGSKKYNELPFMDEPIRTLIAGKVDKVDGKGLSTNDYTTTEKEKLAGIEDGANKYTHPTHTAKASGLYKITVNELGHVTAATAVAKADIVGLGIPAQDTTYGLVTTSADGLMSSEDKTKLDSIAAGAEVNQNAFSNVKVGNSVVTADSKTDTFELVPGTNVQISAATDKITISATDTTYDVATTSKDGLMAAADKSKLDGIAEGANKYTHPATHAATMITQDSSNRFVTDAQIAAWNAKASTAVATASVNGLMSSTDKAKLDGIEDGANKYTHPTHTAHSTSALYKITVDSQGHVSAATTAVKKDITDLGIPSQDTTYTAGTGLELDGTTFNHKNSVTAGTASGTASTTLTFGGTFTIPTVTYDAQGHITGKGTTTMTMPAKPVEYSHPSTHPATMIVEDADHRFVTDTETAKWDGAVTDLSSHTTNKSNPHSVTKAQVGLGNVTNDAQVKRSEMGVANGVATLDSTGKVPSAQLPSYVDDVIEGYYSNGKFHSDSALANVITGESGKIYIDLTSGKTYRWSGTAYAVISETLALGETASTAYPGSSGKANATAIATINEKLNGIESGANKYVHPTHTAYTSGLYKVTVNSLGHVTAATAVAKSDITGLGIPAQDTTYSVATSTANGLMSSTDKAKLDGIAEGANKYTHPTYTSKTSGLYKITVDGTGHVSAATTVAKADITGLGIPAQDTTYTAGTGMKLDGTTFNHSNAVTAGTASGTNSTSLGFGSSFNIPTVTYDAQGHVTASGTTSVKIPNAVATTSAAGLMSKDHVTTLNLLNTNVSDLLTRVEAIETKLQTAVFFG